MLESVIVAQVFVIEAFEVVVGGDRREVARLFLV